MTATPLDVAPRFALGGVIQRGAGARLHTDEDVEPSTMQRKLEEARNGERAAQTLANSVTLDLAIVEQELRDVRQALLDSQVQAEAYRAELEAVRPVVEMARAVAHGHRGVEDMRQAWIEAGL